jgi:hypothetical protein
MNSETKTINLIEAFLIDSDNVESNSESKILFTPDSLIKNSQLFLSSLTTAKIPNKMFHYSDWLLLQQISPFFLQKQNKQITPMNLAFFILEIALNEFFFISELCVFVKSLKN